MLGRAKSAPLPNFGKASTSPRWADIIVGSDDELSDVELFGTTLPTVNEESYRSKPDSAMEDSKTGVNAAMRALTPHEHAFSPHIHNKTHDDGSPKDFGFLLKGRKQCADLELDDVDKENAKAENQKASKADTADTAGQVPRSKQKRRKAPRHGFLQRKRGRVGSGTPKNRSISDSMSEKSDPEKYDDSVETRSVDGASVGGCSWSTLDRHEMPEATEDEWQRREEIRVKAIEMGKCTAAYQKFCAVVPEEQRASHVVQTPNPYDRTISKRKWKDAVNEWRKQLWEHFGDETTRRPGEDAAEDTSKIEQGEPESA